jgi:hypothetical protein
MHEMIPQAGRGEEDGECECFEGVGASVQQVNGIHRADEEAEGGVVCCQDVVSRDEGVIECGVLEEGWNDGAARERGFCWIGVMIRLGEIEKGGEEATIVDADPCA